MLIVTIKNGDKDPLELVVNDLNDVATVQQSILREYQEVQKQDFKFDEERLLDNTPFKTIEDLEEWIDEFDHWDDYRELIEVWNELPCSDFDTLREMAEAWDELQCSDFDSVDEMTERIDSLQSAINEIQDTVRYL